MKRDNATAKRKSCNTIRNSAEKKKATTMTRGSSPAWPTREMPDGVQEIILHYLTLAEWACLKDSGDFLFVLPYTHHFYDACWKQLQGGMDAHRVFGFIEDEWMMCGDKHLPKRHQMIPPNPTVPEEVEAAKRELDSCEPPAQVDGGWSNLDDGSKAVAPFRLIHYLAMHALLLPLWRGYHAAIKDCEDETYRGNLQRLNALCGDVWQPSLTEHGTVRFGFDGGRFALVFADFEKRLFQPILDGLSQDNLSSLRVGASVALSIESTRQLLNCCDAISPTGPFYLCSQFYNMQVHKVTPLPPPPPLLCTENEDSKKVTSAFFKPHIVPPNVCQMRGPAPQWSAFSQIPDRRLRETIQSTLVDSAVLPRVNMYASPVENAFSVTMAFNAASSIRMFEDVLATSALIRSQHLVRRLLWYEATMPFQMPPMPIPPMNSQLEKPELKQLRHDTQSQVYKYERRVTPGYTFRLTPLT